jgi:hypothetical protein
MRLLLSFAAAAILLCPSAQPAAPDDVEAPEITRAKLALEKMRGLVEAGALPRVQLERAEDALGDAQDTAILRRTMYSRDLTDDQSGEMVAAAQRRLDRREKQLDKTRSLVEAGVVASSEIATLEQEAEYARKEYDLAVSRAKLCHELTVMALLEQNQAAHPGPADVPQSVVRYDGTGIFTSAEFQQVQGAFQIRFSKPLPVSAMGETAVHRALGFDHRNRVDVAVNPDQPEGIWLRHYLEARRIPYFAFWQAVPGKATGAHIHMGPMSARLAPGAKVAD